MIAEPGEVLLAFDVGGTAVKAALFDAELNPLGETRLPSRRGPVILDVVEDAALALAEQTGIPLSRVSVAGIAMPGLIDDEHGICRLSVNLDLHDLPVAQELHRRLGIPVRVGHDVLVAGEAVRRFDPGVPDQFVVVIGTGVAAVSFADGRVVRGALGQAGEFGHVVVRPDGLRCPCGGRGCLETVIGARAMLSAYQRRTGELLSGTGELLRRSPDDPVAAGIWTEAAVALADGLAVVCALLAPGRIVLAGGVSGAGPALVEPLSALLAERCRVNPAPPVVVSTLGARAGLVGAAHLARDGLAAVSVC